MTGNDWKSSEMSGNVRKCLEMAVYWMEMSGNCWKLLKMSGNGGKLLDIADNDCKWLEIAVYG